jgi:hypothetical protein
MSMGRSFFHATGAVYPVFVSVNDINRLHLWGATMVERRAAAVWMTTKRMVEERCRTRPAGSTDGGARNLHR